MRRVSCLTTTATWLLLSAIAAANDSGPGPSAGAASKQYSVMVLRANGFEEGTFLFAGSAPTTPSDETDGNQIDEATPTNPDTGAGNDPDSNTTNPVANGDFGPIGSSATTNNPDMMNTGTNTSGTTPTTTTSPPASYWTRARVNGQVSGQTADSSSPDYWTTARANGQAAPGYTSGNVGGGDSGEDSLIAAGTLTANLSEQSSSGTWYSVDLGGFSLWYATTSSADAEAGSVYYAGYATPEMIVGRTSAGTGGFIEALFRGSFFVGQALETTPEDPAESDPVDSE